MFATFDRPHFVSPAYGTWLVDISSFAVAPDGLTGTVRLVSTTPQTPYVFGAILTASGGAHIVTKTAVYALDESTFASQADGTGLMTARRV